MTSETFSEEIKSGDRVILLNLTRGTTRRILGIYCYMQKSGPNAFVEAYRTDGDPSPETKIGAISYKARKEISGADIEDPRNSPLPLKLKVNTGISGDIKCSFTVTYSYM
jgi:hypothetical protein